MPLYRLEGQSGVSPRFACNPFTILNRQINEVPYNQSSHRYCIAEGTLGIVTEMTICLAPVVLTMVVTVQSPNTRKASEAVIEIPNTEIGIRALFLPSLLFLKLLTLHRTH